MKSKLENILILFLIIRSMLFAQSNMFSAGSNRPRANAGPNIQITTNADDYPLFQMINYSHDHSTADSLDYIAIWNASMLQIPEMQEAMQANTEKRPGEFVELPPLRKNASIP